MTLAALFIQSAAAKGPLSGLSFLLCSFINPLVSHFLFCWTRDNFLLSPRRSLQYNLPSYWLILLPCQEVNFHLSFVTPGRLLLIPLRAKVTSFWEHRKAYRKNCPTFWWKILSFGTMCFLLSLIQTWK